MSSTIELSADVGVAPACLALGIPTSTFYDHRRRQNNPVEPKQPTEHPRALAPEERQEILDVLHSDEFVDDSPAQVLASLLDSGIYICSERTMYRILDSENEIKERRNQRKHPIYEKPELISTAPNQVWSWDITKLKGPATWTYFYLYVILDIFSRYVVGWLVADRESTSLAKRLISDSCLKQNIQPGQLTIHADRGSAMKAKALAQLLADLSITKTHSRPSVSNDNPFSESQFKTLKYRPGFPKRFGSNEHALSFCREFFPWYNTQHHHSSIALLTPEDVHYGRGHQILLDRHQVLLSAFEKHPERFVYGPPKLATLPTAVWINPPKSEADPDSEIH